MVFTGEKGGIDGGNDSSSDDFEDDAGDISKKSQHLDGIDSAPDYSNTTERKDIPSEIDFEEEADIARKVLKNLTMPSGTVTAADDSALPKRNTEPNIDESANEPNKLSSETAPTKLSSETAPTKLSSETANASDVTKPQTEEEDDLHRTIFISNLPFEITNEEVKQRFSTFGQVQSFVPVLHPLTKYVLYLVNIIPIILYYS